MKRVLKVTGPFLFLITLIALSACSTMTPARYSVSADTNQILKSFKGNKVFLVSLNAPETYDPNCRLMGPIQAADGISIPEFILKAFNDEFKFADLYDESNGIHLTGSIDHLTFSSISGLTNGWWDIGITLHSENGQSLSISNHYSFPSGFDAITACNQTAQALGAAVQDVIKKAVSHPNFQKLIM
jgi:hypothetical protein